MKTRSFDFRDSLLSLLAISIALFFIFPLYWGFSTSLRNPLDTFTVTGVGLPGSISRLLLITGFLN